MFMALSLLLSGEKEKYWVVRMLFVDDMITGAYMTVLLREQNRGTLFGESNADSHAPHEDSKRVSRSGFSAAFIKKKKGVCCTC